MVADELIKTNKAISRLRYEYEEYNNDETRKVLDILQFHLFLVISYFNKSELKGEDVKERLVEKLAGTL